MMMKKTETHLSHWKGQNQTNDARPTAVGVSVCVYVCASNSGI